MPIERNVQSKSCNSTPQQFNKIFILHSWTKFLLSPIDTYMNLVSSMFFSGNSAQDCTHVK